MAVEVTSLVWQLVEATAQFIKLIKSVTSLVFKKRQCYSRLKTDNVFWNFLAVCAFQIYRMITFLKYLILARAFFQDGCLFTALGDVSRKKFFSRELFFLFWQKKMHSKYCFISDAKRVFPIPKGDL